MEFETIATYTKEISRLSSAEAGRLYVGVAGVCSRLGSTKSRRFQNTFTLELRFLKNLDETPFYGNRQIFGRIFCSEAMGKGEYFREENRTLNFAL